jgi:hypothetical protein
MHLVGFVIRKFVTMHGHMNVKKYTLVRLLKPSIIHFKNRPTNHCVFRSVDIHMLMSHYLLETSQLSFTRMLKQNSWFAARNRLLYRSRFAVLTTELMTIKVFLDMMPRSAQSLKTEVENSSQKTATTRQKTGNHIPEDLKRPDQNHLIRLWHSTQSFVVARYSLFWVVTQWMYVVVH